MNRNYWIGKSKDSGLSMHDISSSGDRVIEGKPQLETSMANHKSLKHS